MTYSKFLKPAKWAGTKLLGVRERDYELNRARFKAYGPGWRLTDVHGIKEFSDTGTIAGVYSCVVRVSMPARGKIRGQQT